MANRWVRSEIPKLVAKLAAVAGIDDLAMTTNGMLLAQQAAALKQAGLQRLNISLDAMREETFERIARRRGLDQVLAGIAAARREGFRRIRLNTVAIRGITEDEIVPLANFACQLDLELRFIEFMPLDAERRWQNELVLPGDEIRARLEAEFGPLMPAERPDPSQPAVDYRLANGGRIGFINPVSQPFCGDCNRLRITAEGQVRNCLFSTVEWDAGHPARRRQRRRSGRSDPDLRRRQEAWPRHRRAGLLAAPTSHVSNWRVDHDGFDVFQVTHGPNQNQLAPPGPAPRVDPAPVPLVGVCGRRLDGPGAARLARSPAPR